jgi:hypothetical protein
MVPASYHSFFTDTAQVAGTLIGLLFVAVSLAPEKLDGHDADLQIKAGIAFAALINGLVIGLTALLPGDHLAITATILACGGISSAIGLGAITFRQALRAFRHQVVRHWMTALRRRSQRTTVTWERMTRLEARWLPTPRILHPWPEQRFRRQHPRQEPSAVFPHAGICAGGGPNLYTRPVPTATS